MALSTFAELKSSIADWLARTDLTTVIVDFVALAESDIRRDVRMASQESLATGTLTGETLAFPTRFLEAKRLVVDGYPLRYITPDEYQSWSTSGAEQDVYTIIGESFYILGGASGDTYSLIYFAGFAAFSADSDTNALLTNAPEVYLYGAMKHASIYLKDDADIAKYAAAYQAALQKVNLRERAKATTGARLFVAAA